MSHNNSNDIQYWIWACLNKKFGSSVRLRRSYVARMYEVNKHDTDIMCIGLHKQDVIHFLEDLLKRSGYVEEDYCLVKIWTHGTNCYKNYFHFMESGNPQEFFITHHLYKL